MSGYARLEMLYIMIAVELYNFQGVNISYLTNFAKKKHKG